MNWQGVTCPQGKKLWVGIASQSPHWILEKSVFGYMYSRELATSIVGNHSNHQQLIFLLIYKTKKETKEHFLVTKQRDGPFSNGF